MHPRFPISSQPLSFVRVFLTIVVSGAVAVQSACSDEPPAPSSEQTVDYSIIVTGSELLSGVYADGHTLYITKTLRPLGLHCVGSVSVDDQDTDISQALQFTLARSQLVIVTGGLGPTESDITRDVLSAFTGIELREQPELLRQMAQRFSTPIDELRTNLRRQTRVPVQGTFLPNATGTAVGLVFAHDGRVIAALPGPPRELQPMVRNHLIPYLAKRFGVRTLGSSLTVRFVGLGQSQIDQVLRDHVQLPADAMQTSQFSSGRVDFTFSLPGDRPEDRQRLEKLRRDLHKTLGDNIYSDDATTTLEEAAIKQLAARKQTVAVAEMGSGGLLATGFAQTPGKHNVLAGAFVTASPEQMHRALQIPADRWSTADLDTQLALIARATQQRVGSDWAIVVSPPLQVDGSNQVHMLIRTPEGKLVRHSWPWRSASPSDLSRLATLLFDFVRRTIAQHQGAATQE